MLATLLISRGTPMILAGDEFGRTQDVNNNAYCQDSEISWLNWNIEGKGENLIRFVSRLAALRRRLPILHRSRWLTAEYNDELGVKDATWFTPDAEEMETGNWSDSNAKSIGLVLDGRAQPTGIRRRGQDATLFLIMNSHYDIVQFRLPEVVGGGGWRCLIDTNQTEIDEAKHFEFGAVYDVTGRSLILFELKHDQSYETARVQPHR